MVRFVSLVLIVLYASLPGCTEEQCPTGVQPAGAFSNVVAITVNRADPFEFRWVPCCEVGRIDVHEKVSHKLLWTIATEALDGVVSPVPYGKMPAGARQLDFVGTGHQVQDRRWYTVTVWRRTGLGPIDGELVGSQRFQYLVSSS